MKEKDKFTINTSLLDNSVNKDVETVEITKDTSVIEVLLSSKNLKARILCLAIPLFLFLVFV
jgi:hypothetical protein